MHLFRDAKHMPSCGLSVHWTDATVEDGDNCTIMQTPVILRAAYRADSFGHLMRDNVQALVELPLLFGLQPENFTWAVWAPATSEKEAPNLQLVHHYEPWYSKFAAIPWQSFVARFRGELTLRSSNRGATPMECRM